MSNYVMSVDFFGNAVRCETEGSMVSLNDLINAGNAYRLSRGKSAFQMAAFLNSASTAEYVAAAVNEWGVPESELIKKIGTGKKNVRTMVHISVAVLAAEAISPEFHARIHKEFIDGKLLQFREAGGTEFKKLNVAIDTALPNKNGRDNKRCFVEVAFAIRSKILGKNATSGSWDKANLDQTTRRFEVENKLAEFIKFGFVKDFNHLIEIVGKL